jgi:outer membrane protein assembly factor BamB
MPAVDEGRVFVQEGNTLAALDASTGRRLWTRQIRVAPFPGPSTLLADGGHVYVSETDSLMALDAATGTTIWNVHPDSQAVTETALDQDTFYSGQRGIPVVYALSRVNGSIRWKVNVGVGYSLPAHVRGVAVAGDTVLASVERCLSASCVPSSGVVIALDRRDGRELWRFETPSAKNYFRDAPIAAGRLVILNDVGTGDAVAVDVVTRREVWRTPVGAATRVMVVGNVVYTGGNQTVMALDLQTGATRWSAETGSTAFGIGICDGSLFASAFALRRFNLATGAQMGELGKQGGYVSQLASNGSMGFVTGALGTVAVRCNGA